MCDLKNGYNIVRAPYALFIVLCIVLDYMDIRYFHDI